MADSSMQHILSAPLISLSPSTQEERKVFPEQTDGWFYTFQLKSGQSFVAHLDKWDTLFTFRPLNNLIPHLVQFQWKRKRVLSVHSPWFDTACQVKPGLSEEERKLLVDTLSPQKREYKESSAGPTIFRDYYPVMLEKAWGLQKQLKENEDLRMQLLKGQKYLQNLLVCRDDTTRNPTVQQNNQERR